MCVNSRVRGGHRERVNMATSQARPTPHHLSKKTFDTITVNDNDNDNWGRDRTRERVNKVTSTSLVRCE